MGKFIFSCITLVAIIFLAGMFPTVAVGLTALGVIALMLVFGKEV